jgi:hypothetical protein
MRIIFFIRSINKVCGECADFLLCYIIRVLMVGKLKFTSAHGP